MTRIGYGVFYEDGGVYRVANLPIAPTKEGGDALLLVFKLQYKNLGEGAFVAEIHRPSQFQEGESHDLRGFRIPMRMA